MDKDWSLNEVFHCTNWMVPNGDCFVGYTDLRFELVSLYVSGCEVFGIAIIVISIQSLPEYAHAFPERYCTYTVYYIVCTCDLAPDAFPLMHQEWFKKVLLLTTMLATQA